MDEETKQEETQPEEKEEPSFAEAPEDRLGWRITEDELAIALEKVRNGFEW